MNPTEYDVVAAHDDKYCRIELRQYPDRWVMVRLRPKGGGGWYIRESIECTIDPRTKDPRRRGHNDDVTGPRCGYG